MATRDYERIDLRTTPEMKELIVRAASAAGMTVSAFLLGTAQVRAKEILAEQELVTLTARDWVAFVNALDSVEKWLSSWGRGHTQGHQAAAQTPLEIL